MAKPNERVVADAVSASRAAFKTVQRLSREVATLAEGAEHFGARQATPLNRATRELYAALGHLESAGVELAEAQKLLGP